MNRYKYIIKACSSFDTTLISEFLTDMDSKGFEFVCTIDTIIGLQYVFRTAF